MPDMPDMPDIKDAYNSAHYVIGTKPPITLCIGKANTDLKKLSDKLQCHNGIFITACNPHSRLLKPAANQRRTLALEKCLSHAGYKWLPATGIDPAGKWPDEPGFWVMDIPIKDAVMLARRFRQNAIVYTGIETCPHLIWVYKI